jgi:hypothetical protein
LDGDGRAGGVARAAPDLHLAPACLAAQRYQHALIEDFKPAATIFALLLADIYTDDFGAAQAGKADQQHRPIPQAA